MTNKAHLSCISYMSIYRLYFASICDVMLERQRDRQRDRLTEKTQRDRDSKVAFLSVTEFSKNTHICSS